MTRSTSRREFLRQSARFAGLGTAAPFALNLAALGSAAAQSAADYKALVCVFLYGGNDHHNTVIPYDTAAYAEYQRARPGIARARSELVALSASARQGGRAFALPTELGPLAGLYESGRLAVVANVGPLSQPTTRAQYESRSVPLPPKLFSHNDQQSVWQASVPEGAREGWGGRIGDVLAAGNRTGTFTSVSLSGNAAWSSGRSTLQFQVSPAGPAQVNPLAGSTLFGSALAPSLLRQSITTTRSHVLQNDHAQLMQRALDANAELRTALSGVPAFQTPFPDNNGLAAQLRMTARLIAARQALGARRQVFFVSLGGFDHHAFLSGSHPPLLAQVGAALGAFDAVLGELGLRDRVTTFTASDFGRALLSNGDGSDHGWGSHHLVMGGAVRGREVYGSFPATVPGTPEDAGQGRQIPTTSVDQYAATLGRWMGLGESQLDDVLPNLRQFDRNALPMLA
jgi:uncharacterized protein (DUF1501 family)